MTGLFASLARRFAGNGPTLPDIAPRPRPRFEGENAEAGFTELNEERLAPAVQPAPPRATGAPRSTPSQAAPLPTLPELRPMAPQDPPVVQKAASPPAAPTASPRPRTGGDRVPVAPPLEDPFADPAPLPAMRPDPRRASVPAPQPPDPRARREEAPPPARPQDADMRITTLAATQAPRAAPPTPSQPMTPARAEQPAPRAPDPGPGVEIRIGRIEVSTPAPAPAPPPRPAPAKLAAPRAARPASGLTDYLGWKR